MKIIAYKPEFAQQVTDLFHDTIHEIAAADYTKEELDIWAPTPMDYEAWKKRLECTRPWLVIKEDKVLGFGELDNDGYIDCFYVHKDYQHKGIGRFLLNWIEQVALRSGNLKLYADVSITAKPFFKMQGFRVIRPNLVFKGEFMLKNYVMEKDI